MPDAIETSLLQLGIKILQPLGRGRISTVFRGTADGREVAVKVFDGTDKGHLQRLRDEATTLARLNDPGLAKIFRFEEQDGHSFLVMEYLSGGSLADRLRRGPLPHAEVVELAITLAGALSEVHRRQLVHRDVKPENIVFDDSGVPRLLDFDLVQPLDRKPDGAAVGTFAYAPPEQNGMLKRPVDGRSDLYALGVLLFQCTTGLLPFISSDMADLIHMHAATSAPDVLSLVPGASRALSRIIAKLLRKDPDDRYQTAEGLLSDLRRLPELESGPATDRVEALGTDDEQGQTGGGVGAFVGRQAELNQLQALAQRAKEGHGGALLVQGPSGMGKTVLVRELLAPLRAGGASILAAKCSLTASAPLWALRSAIDGHLAAISRLPGAEQEREVGIVRQAAQGLESLLQGFSARLTALLQAGKPDAAAATRDQFHQAVADFLLRLSAPERLTVLLIDDVQWLDDSSLSVLQKLSTSLPARAFLLCATARDDEHEAAAVEAFSAALHPTHLPLHPLGHQEVRQILSHQLGGREVSEDLTSRVLARSQGNAMAVGEFFRAMLENGCIRFSGAQWVVDLARMEDLKLPGNVLNLVTRRVGELSEESQQVLRIAAVLGNRFELQFLARVAQSAPEPVARAVAEASRAALVERESKGSFGFVHDRVREALLASASAEELRAIHSRAARALEDDAAQDDPERVFALALHHAQGDRQNPPRIFETNRAAASAALRTYAFRDGLGFLTEASRAAQEGGVALDATFHEMLGRACVGTDQLKESLQHFDEGARLSRTALEFANLKGLKASAHVSLADFRSARRDLRAAFDRLGSPMPRGRVSGLLGSIARWLWSGLVARLGWRPVGEERSAINRLLIRLLHLVSYMAFFDVDVATLIQSVLVTKTLATPLRECSEKANADINFAFITGTLLRPSARKYMASAIAMAERLGDSGMVAQGQQYSALVETWLGVRDSSILRRTGERYGRWMSLNDWMNCRLVAGLEDLLRGHEQQAIQLLEETAEKTRELSGKQLLLNHMPLSELAAILAIHGDTQRSQLLFAESERMENETPEVLRYMRAHLRGMKGVALAEQPGREAEFQRVRAEFEALQLNPLTLPFPLTPLFVFAAHADLEAAWRANDAQRPAALQALRASAKALARVAKQPVLRMHQRIIAANLAALSGESPARVQRQLGVAEHLLTRLDAPYGQYLIALTRARMLGRAASTAQPYARMAQELARRHGWPVRQERVTSEFGLGESLSGHRSLDSSVRSSSHASGVLQDNRRLNALLEVSSASASVLDVDEVARVGLDCLNRILGSERAFLFLKDEQGALVAKRGRGANGQDLPALTGFSNTFINRVARSHVAQVTSATESGEISTQSAIAHNLRSMMAAPVLLADEFLGVVYLDSTLAKGVFTSDDAEILRAIAQQIGISLSTARAARMEVQNREYEKDLAVTAAVQALLLPKASVATYGGVEVAGYYRSATQSGGDWWWHQRLPDGRVVVLVGDVTGHGAGSAMVTSAVASAYVVLTHGDRRDDMGEVLRSLNRHLQTLCQDQYHMTFAVAELDPRTGTLQTWLAGAPPLQIRRADGSMELINATSEPLGQSAPNIVQKTLQLRPGDRLLVVTDGCSEFTQASGRPLGEKGLSRVLQKCTGDGAHDRDLIRATFDGATVLEDDLTFVLMRLDRLEGH